jgi:hypothetical protein
LSYSKGLDYETKDSYVFRVVAVEGQVPKDTVTLNISVLNVNDWDPQFKYPAYEFAVTEEDLDRGSKIGEVQVRAVFVRNYIIHVKTA